MERMIPRKWWGTPGRARNGPCAAPSYYTYDANGNRLTETRVVPTRTARVTLGR